MTAILFGSIGSVVETSETQRRAFNAAFHQHGLDWDWDVARYTEMLKVSGGAKRIAQYAKDHGQTVDAAAIHKTKTKQFLEKLASDDIVPRDGVIDVLDYAKSKGWRTGFVSMTEPETIAIITAKVKDDQAAPFDVITSRALGLADKPSPDAYLYSLKELSLKPSDVIVIEDNLDGVRAAKAAGLYVLAYPGAFDDPKDFDQADAVVQGGLLDAVVAAVGK